MKKNPTAEAVHHHPNAPPAPAEEVTAAEAKEGALGARTAILMANAPRVQAATQSSITNVFLGQQQKPRQQKSRQQKQRQQINQQQQQKQR